MSAPAPAQASVVVVAYGVTSLDLSWAAREGIETIVVHNDDRLEESACKGAPVMHIYAGGNVGFGAGVNLALAAAKGHRIVLCNPDASPEPLHLSFLATGSPDVVRAVEMVDAEGRRNSVVSRYPTPLSLTLTALRLGRFAPRGGAFRRLAAPFLGRWGRAHARSLSSLAGSKWPLSEYWCAGTLCSFDRARLEEVSGFDESYFLYREDIDLCRRLAARHKGMFIELAELPPAVHVVGGTATTNEDRTRVRWSRWNTAALYSGRQTGPGWALAGGLTRSVAAWLARSSPVKTLLAERDLRRSGTPPRYG